MLEISAKNVKRFLGPPVKPALVIAKSSKETNRFFGQDGGELDNQDMSLGIVGEEFSEEVYGAQHTKVLYGAQHDTTHSNEVLYMLSPLQLSPVEESLSLIHI